MERGDQCVRLTVQYFRDRFRERGALFPAIRAFRARLFGPGKVSKVQPEADDINDLRAFPFFSAAEINAMPDELPDYQKCTSSM